MKILIALLICGSFAHAQDFQVIDLQSDNPNISMISASGTLGVAMANALNAKLDKNLKKGLRTAVFFESDGGLLEETTAVANVVTKFSDRFFKKYNMSTLFVSWEQCSSACTVFLTYLNRNAIRSRLELIMSSTTQLYFHGPRRKAGEHFVPFPNGELYERKLSVLYANYLNSGINPTWLREHSEWFNAPQSETKITGEELCKSDSRIVAADSCLPVKDLTLRVEQALEKAQSLLPPTK